MRLRSLTILPLVALLALSGCYARARVSWRATVPSEVVVTAPPPPLHEPVRVRPAAPAAHAVWVHGHWKWEANAWVWVDGHWEPNRAGYVWVAPVAEDRGGTIVYHPGYWIPEDREPEPVYRNPGVVRVSVRPAATATVTARPADEQGTVSARPASGGTTTVTARPASGGTTTVRASGSTTVTARGTATGSRPSGGVNEADSGVAVAARPAGSGTVTATPATANTGGATATARTPTTVTANTGGATATGTAPATVSANPGGATDGAPPVRTRVGTATVQQPGSGTTQQVRLQCAISTERAPLGGLITVTGTFQSNATVQIGGETAPIVNRRARQLRVRVPGSSGGGMVRVRQGQQSADCGTLTVAR